MQAIKNAGLLVLALAGSLLYWSLGQQAGLLLLLFTLSLAIVGKGNRLIWSAAFPLACCLIGAPIYTVYSVMPPSAEFAKLSLAAVLFPAVPGVVLWLAVRLKQWRQRHADVPRQT